MSSVIQTPAEILSRLQRRLSELRNTYNVTQEPYAPGWIKLSGEARDDGAIPPHAPRERVASLYFRDVLVRENASSDEMHAAIRQHIRSQTGITT